MLDIPALIKTRRKALKESQEEFAKRFGVSHATISYWESGTSEAPYAVIDFILGEKNNKIVCTKCGGKGWVAI